MLSMHRPLRFRFLLPCILFCTAHLPAQDAGETFFEGLILPFNDYQLGSAVEAVVTEIVVREGDWVKEGDVLAVLHTDKEVLVSEQAAKRLEQARFMHLANERLVKEKAVSEERALESRITYELAAIASRLAQADIEDKTVRAPADGQVIRVHREHGEIIARSQELIQLLDYHKVYLQLYLPGEWIGRLELGQVFPITIPLLGAEPVQGEVTFVDPVIDPGSGLFRLKLLIDNPEARIKPGMSASVDLSTASEQTTGIAADSRTPSATVSSP